MPSWVANFLTRAKDYYVEHPNITMFVAGFASATIIWFMFS